MSTEVSTREQTKKTAPRRSKQTSATAARGATKLAQVRLRPEEMAALQEVMRTLNLGSTSDALREGLRLLFREANETKAADDIRTFYHDVPVPLPDGVVAPGDAELEAADKIQW